MWVGGRYTGTNVKLGPTPLLPSSGGFDGFVARIAGADGAVSVQTLVGPDDDGGGVVFPVSYVGALVLDGNNLPAADDGSPDALIVNIVP